MVDQLAKYNEKLSKFKFKLIKKNEGKISSMMERRRKNWFSAPSIRSLITNDFTSFCDTVKKND